MRTAESADRCRLCLPFDRPRRRLHRRQLFQVVVRQGRVVPERGTPAPLSVQPTEAELRAWLQTILLKLLPPAFDPVKA